MRFILRWALLTGGLVCVLLVIFFTHQRSQSSAAWHIVFWGDEDLFQVDINGQHLRKLKPFENPTYWIPQWSHDNQWMIYDGDNGAIYRTNSGGTRTIQLTFPPTGASDEYSTYSPHSDEFIFVRYWQGSSILYLGDENGVQALTDENLTSIYSIQWSPTQRQILFEARYQNEYDIFVYDIPTTELINLTSQVKISYKIYPSWSADGEWVALVADDDLNQSVMRVFVVRADGQDLHPITPLEFDRLMYEASWSPTGELIAILNEDWQTYDGIRFDFFTPKGQHVKTIKLAEIYVYEEEWLWSPDGRWLIFNDDYGYIYRLEVATGELTLIARDDDEFFYFPGIAPALNMPWHLYFLIGIAGFLIWAGIFTSYSDKIRFKI